MANDGESDLIALVEREQRGFRLILFSGLATLLLLVVMSAALGFYYFDVSRDLSSTARQLQKQAFETRRQLDQQNNRVSAQETRIRRVHEEIRRLGGYAGPRKADGASLQAALDGARQLINQGGVSLTQERLIETEGEQEGPEQIGSDTSAAPAARALLRASAGMLQWVRSGEAIAGDAKELPPVLAQALADFQAAGAEEGLAPLAQAGQAWVRFVDASSPRSNFRQADCEAVFAAAALSAARAPLGPQPLYWRAQCARKLGRTKEALRDYAQAVAQGGVPSEEFAARTLAMNAFHGLGSVMIAAFALPESAAEMQFATQIARKACPIEAGPIPASAGGSARMQLAVACLRQAMEWRRRLRQTPNELSGSAENISFAYLRDENFQAAFDNARIIERTGLFPWNELVRALAAQHLVDGEGQEGSAAEARRNVSFFTVGQFNLCELQVLLSPPLYQEALALIRAAHPKEEVDCAAAR